MADPDRRCLFSDPDLALWLRIGLLGTAFLCLVAAGLAMAMWLACQ